MRLMVGLWLLLVSSLLGAAEPRGEMTGQERERTLILLNEPVVMFQASLGSLTPEARVRRAKGRIATLDESDLQVPVEVESLQRFGQSVRFITLNGKRLVMLVEKDLDESDELTLDQAADRVRERLEKMRLQFIELRSPAYLAKAAALALGSALLLGAFLLVLHRGYRRTRQWLGNRLLMKRSWLPESWRPLIGPIELRLLGAMALVVVVIALYLWLTYVLGLFPHTRVWSQQLGQSLLALCARLLEGGLAALPGLATVLIIVVVTRFFIRLLGLLFDRVQRGQVEIQGLHAETVGATRRLMNAVIWLFALTVAYPYLPGADSDAFKGVSVFFGLMVTLGSAGVMNHAMSGLVLIYSRALRKGDWVRIGEVEGQVSELNALSTKIVTREEHEVTLPNAVVVGGRITNLSRLAAGRGLPLLTRVTIGYDTPWRQVQAMLELAARRTPGLNGDETPLVRQLGLLDWYVEYELQVWVNEGEKPALIRSRLHGVIQDVFNEFGVQIMSPNFVAQPPQNLVVPKAQWYAAPASAEDNKR